MHVIARPTIRAFCAKHADARDWLENWWRIASKARWQKLEDVRRIYQSADQAGSCLVFNCKGAAYRLIVRVSYANRHTRGTLLVKHFLTHAEYNKNNWKQSCT
jgi:mRNA interferase HigB